jgi:hypothetical protein
MEGMEGVYAHVWHVGVEAQKAWRYRRHGSTEGMEIQKAWKYRRHGDV